MGLPGSQNDCCSNQTKLVRQDRRLRTIAGAELGEDMVDMGLDCCLAHVQFCLDTFVVRPLLMPALATLLGRWNWVWPRSRLWKRPSVKETVPEAQSLASATSDGTSGS
jgi:uncharacterized membrane protein YdfJ with MMPL/SSD domain